MTPTNELELSTFDKELNKILADFRYQSQSKTTVQAIKQLISTHIIGENIKPHMDGKEVARGETVTIDLENNMKESLIFIEDNAKYSLQQDMRKKLGEE